MSAETSTDDPSETAQPDVDSVHSGDRNAVLETIANQSRELYDQSQPTVTCPCGVSGPLKGAFRCFYCEVYFCPNCAETHFETRSEPRGESDGVC